MPDLNKILGAKAPLTLSGLARGAQPLAEVAGFAMTADASDIVMPSQDGAARAMAGALSDAGLVAEEVGYINAHGTGTAANDRTETAAIRQVFGPHADRLAVSSTKAMHGHLIGATGAVEMLAVLLDSHLVVVVGVRGVLDKVIRRQLQGDWVEMVE